MSPMMWRVLMMDGTASPPAEKNAGQNYTRQSSANIWGAHCGHRLHLKVLDRKVKAAV
jgi:hypothetical protein